MKIAFSIQHSAFSIQHSAFSIQHSAFSIQHSAFSIQHSAFSVSQAWRGANMRRGFTLIELSIVLVIIALIVGGVMIGRELIKSAQLRKVITDTELFSTAFNAFKNKYNCIPGDCATASNFFSGTVNGNGDQVIGWTNGGAVGCCEGAAVWNQLANAGLINGAYIASSNLGGLSKRNFYIGPVGDSGYIFKRCALGATSCYTGWDGLNGGMENYGYNLLILGKFRHTDYRMFDHLLTGSQLKSIDVKADDGMPNTGRIGGAGGWSNCADTSNLLADYKDLNNLNINCVLVKKF